MGYVMFNDEIYRRRMSGNIMMRWFIEAERIHIFWIE